MKNNKCCTSILYTSFLYHDPVLNYLHKSDFSELRFEKLMFLSLNVGLRVSTEKLFENSGSDPIILKNFYIDGAIILMYCTDYKQYIEFVRAI